MVIGAQVLPCVSQSLANRAPAGVKVDSHVHLTVADFIEPGPGKGCWAVLEAAHHQYSQKVRSGTGNLQSWERDQKLAAAVDVNIVAALGGICATLTIRLSRREILGLVRKVGGATADDGVHRFELRRVIPASIARVIVRNAELTRSASMLRPSSKLDESGRARLDERAGPGDVRAVLAGEREVAVEGIDLDIGKGVEVVWGWRRHDHVAAGAVEEQERGAKECKHDGCDYHDVGVSAGVLKFSV